MKKYLPLIIADAALSLLTIIAILAYHLFIQIDPPGFIVISLIVVLSLNTIFCIFSVVAINRGRDRLVSKLWISLFTLVVFYLLADLLGGVLFLGVTDDNRNIIPDKIVHHKERADAVIREYMPGEFDVTYTTNNLGFRGRSVSVEKNPSIFRILMLGDSFTFGAGVEDDETAPHLLERYLNQYSEGKYEVINLGIDSYSPILQYLQLKENIELLKPDMVIMNFDMSDVVQEYVYRQGAKFGVDGEPLAVDGFPDYMKRRGTPKAKVMNWVYEHLFITTALIEFLRRHFEKEVGIENLDLENTVMRKNRLLLQHTLEDHGFQDFGRFMAMVEDSILRAKKLCDRYGSAFILSVYPWGHQVNDEEWVPGRYRFLPRSFEISDRTVQELERFSGENEIPFFNAFPDFRNYEGVEPLYFKNDMHFTAAGQELMAGSLYKFLMEYFDETKNHDIGDIGRGVSDYGN